MTSAALALVAPPVPPVPLHVATPTIPHHCIVVLRALLYLIAFLIYTRAISLYAHSNALSSPTLTIRTACPPCIHDVLPSHVLHDLSKDMDRCDPPAWALWHSTPLLSPRPPTHQLSHFPSPSSSSSNSSKNSSKNSELAAITLLRSVLTDTFLRIVRMPVYGKPVHTVPSDILVIPAGTRPAIVRTLLAEDGGLTRAVLQLKRKQPYELEAELIRRGFCLAQVFGKDLLWVVDTELKKLLCAYGTFTSQTTSPLSSPLSLPTPNISKHARGAS